MTGSLATPDRNSRLPSGVSTRLPNLRQLPVVSSRFLLVKARCMQLTICLHSSVEPIYTPLPGGRERNKRPNRPFLSNCLASSPLRKASLSQPQSFIVLACLSLSSVPQPTMKLSLPLIAALPLPLAWALPSQFPFAQSAAPSNKVPVALGVMSRCPDAKLCEDVWDKVLDKVGDLVDLELVFIGKKNSSAPYGVTCMHGEEECVGNIQQLCAAKVWEPISEGTVKPWADWWNFVQCVNYGPRAQIGKLETAKHCAKVVGHLWTDDLQSCVTDGTGEELLQASVQRSVDLGIINSCTVLISENKVCVHDETWKRCPGGHEVGDFAAQVKAEWTRLNQVA